MYLERHRQKKKSVLHRLYNDNSESKNDNTHSRFHILSKQSHFTLHVHFDLSQKQIKFDRVNITNDKNFLRRRLCHKEGKTTKKMNKRMERWMGRWIDGRMDIHLYVSKPTYHCGIMVHSKEKSVSMSQFPWSFTKIQKCGSEEKASCHSLKHGFTIVYIFFFKENMLTEQLWQENHQRKQEQEAPEKLIKGQHIAPLSSHQAIQPHPQLPSWKPAPGRPSLCKDHPHEKRLRRSL